MSANVWYECWRRRRADAAAACVVVLAFCAAFGWAVFRGRFLIGGDVFFYTYPLRTVGWRMIRAGVLPVWTPLVFSGYPLLAMVQLGFGYPLTWAHLLLPDHWAEELYVLAPFLLSPIFTYAYAREVGRTRLAALLAGLAYAYGGLTTNTYGMNAIPTNALMWLPLVLVALERARRAPFAPCLLGASVAYAMSVLTGHAQSFLTVGLLAAGYALCLACAPPQQEERRTRDALPGARMSRWRPLLVAACACVLGACVGAFQMLETWRAARLSVRRAISYEYFSAGAFTPRDALLSFVAPLYHYVEVSTYIVPLALALALYAVVRAARTRAARDPRILFWLAVAIVSFLLMLGNNTPLYTLVYRVPVLNLFRTPSRHAFEWTFALSVLAAYGWDAARAAAGARTSGAGDARGRKEILIGTLFVALAAACGVLWWLAVNRDAHAVLFAGAASARAYVVWKTLCALCVLLACWCGLRRGAARGREALLTCALVLGCLCEPLILIARWWPGTMKPAARFTTPGLATRYLQTLPPAEHRVYVHANLGLDENASTPRLDVLDQTAPYGLNNVGGYEPMILTRYSRALGDVDYDAVRPRAGHTPPLELFAPQSHVLDLLNTTHVVAFRDFMQAPPASRLRRAGIEFATADLALELTPGAAAHIDAARATADTLALVTSLSNSVAIAQDAEVARVRVFNADGRTIELSLRAGRDTAEWAHERADVRALVAHKLAPVFDTRAVDESAGAYAARRYWTRLPLDVRVQIERIEIKNVAPAASLAVWKASLYDSSSGQSFPLTTRRAPTLDPARWQTEAEFDGVLVLGNARALPRAWLVTEAEAVDGEEALHRIRGESAHDFDPRRTALLEVGANELPTLAGGEMTNSAARITAYEPAHLRIETDAPRASVLVVSEINYPGWEATVDGQAARILPTDYLLRGVVLPAGRHQVEMHYAAPAARAGAILSVCALLSLCALFVYARRRRMNDHAQAGARA